MNERKPENKRIADIVALTPMQEGMLFHYLADQGSRQYRVQLLIEIAGPINLPFFEQAWNEVIAHNEMLRTAFRWQRVKNPVQVILKEHRLRPAYHDLSEESGEERARLATEITDRQKGETFDLRDVPFRVTLMKMAHDLYNLVICHHHILYDGWSQAIILREFFDTYADLSNNRPPTPSKKRPFQAYVKWIQSRSADRERKFWQAYLRQVDAVAHLAVKKRRDRNKEIESTENHRVPLPPGARQEFEQFSQRSRITLAALLYTGWGVLLQKYNDCGDAVFGTTVSGRSADIKGIENIVGLFINTIPLRIEAESHENITALLKRVNDRLQIRREYEATPLVKVREYCEWPEGEELFATLVVLENYPLDFRAMQVEGKLSVRSYSLAEATHYDLTVTIRLFDDIEADISYNPAAFDRETIASLATHYARILTYMRSHPDQSLAHIDMLSPQEKQAILFRYNDTETEYPAHVTLDQLFEERRQKIPDRIALKGRSGEGHYGALTYRELDRQAVRVAETLRARGVQTAGIVALQVRRSGAMMAAILGILKAGGAYLPIDPDCPPERLRFMLADSGAEIVLGDRWLDRLSGLSGPGRVFRQAAQPGPMSLAYVIYTSGSTGRPKGVAVENRSVVNFITGMMAIIPFKEDDRVLSLTTISFDIFVLESLLPLTGGAGVVMGGPEEQMKAAAAAAAIKKETVTIFQLTPSRLQLFMENDQFADSLKRLKYLLVGGEQFPLPLLQQVQPLTSARIFNMYGPTETTVWSTVKALDKNGALNIGRPIANTRVFILSKTGALQPHGVAGELCIGGHGLARGYLNKPELTAERFLNLAAKTREGTPGPKHQPLTPKSYILYRTGDLCRFLPDGDIEFIGRLDHQLKIRGYRIELGEIEAGLLTHPAVQEAVVLARESGSGEKSLVAYIVPSPTTKTNRTNSLREYLSRRLPAYMVPSLFVTVEQIPLTASGKVDRKALAAAHPETVPPGLQAPQVAPRQGEEAIIADIWRQVLQLDQLGIDDRLFDVGGNSLTAIRINSRLEETFMRDIPITALFRYPTIRELAGYIRQAGAEHNRNDEEEGAKGEPRGKEGIAVIGMAGRFPGAGNIAQFWDNLRQGVESIRFFSPRELASAGVAARLIGNPQYVTAKGVLEDIEYFDAPFFDYTAREAERMDPQMRLLHECAWEALEDAGYDPLSYDGAIGFYAGALPNSRWLSLLSEPVGKHSEMMGLISLNDRDFLSTRISYKLNLKGPAVTVQTACSTSLVAVDAACSALLAGKCDMALAGGVSITLEDQTGYIYEEGMVRSPDGRCRAFAAEANGTAAGNGVGLVVLRPLSEAAARGDHVYAVVRGSAVNNDGVRKPGYTAPSIEGQAEVIGAAQQMAGVSAESIGYLEAHGTGTVLGDPVEIEGLKLAFNTRKRGYCALGSVKTNVGHLDAAAGIAGFIKAVLALHHKFIPPSLHFRTPNPRIDFENSPFFVVSEPTAWKAHGYPRRAGVSSFGIGGTNAHVVLEEYRPEDTADMQSAAQPAQLIVLSARSEAALEKMTENLGLYFKANPHLHLAAAAHTLQRGRRPFACRRMFVCADLKEAAEALTTRNGERLHTFTNDGQERSAVFMFPGQGAQYVDMGRGLYQRERVFRQEMDRCLEILKPLTGYDLKEILYPDTPPDPAAGYPPQEGIDGTEVAQPLLFAIEYALAKLLMRWGIQPAAMIGHSVGEYAAACLSGVFALEDALAVVAQRGRLMQQLPPGLMYRVTIPAQELEPMLLEGVSLAAVNAPQLCVVSGSPGAVEAQIKHLIKRGFECGQLHTSHAFHSAMMEPILAEFESRVGEMRLNRPEIPYISNLTGTWITEAEAADPAYWARHLRQTVRFSAGLERLRQDRDSIFIEVGPGRTLSTLVHKYPHKQTQDRTVNLIRHPRETADDGQYIREQIGRFWLYGGRVDWSGLHEPERQGRIPLPTYPFEGQRYWPKGAPPPGIPADEVCRWFYRPTWKEQPLAPSAESTAPAPGVWLVFLAGWGSRIVERLKAEGQRVIIARAAGDFGRADDGALTLNPREPAHYDALLAEAGILAGKTTALRILHLWSLRPDLSDPPDPADQEILERSLDLGFYSLLYLAQAVGRQDGLTAVQVFVVTNNMQEVSGGDLLCPLSATLLGAVQVIPLEYRQIKICSIDIDLRPRPVDDEPEAMDQLWAELHGDLPQGQAAYRQGRRWLPSYEPVTLKRSTLPLSPLKAKGVYVIVGGLGGIGLKLAEHLAKTLQARLILTSSSPFPDRKEWRTCLKDSGVAEGIKQKIAVLQRLEDQGAEILVFSADVTDRQRMRQVLNRVEERFGAVDGVILAAGRADGRLVQGIGRKHAQHILAPKVEGLLVLNSLIKDRPPDFFMLFSSINVLVPTPGQACYTAANAFLDAFARYKQADAHTSFLSIDWDTWQEVGMAVSALNKAEKDLKPIDHPLLHGYLERGEAGVVYVSRLHSEICWLLAEHRLEGQPMLPGTGSLEIVRAAFAHHTGRSVMEMRQVYFLSPLVTADRQERQIHIVLKKRADHYEFSLQSRSAASADWDEHVRGKLLSITDRPSKRFDLADIETGCRNREIYFGEGEYRPRAGAITYGPRWSNIRAIKLGERQALSFGELPPEFSQDIGTYRLHPALLDTASLSCLDNLVAGTGGAYLPFGYQSLTIKGDLPERIVSHVRWQEAEPFQQEIQELDVTVMDDRGGELLDIRGYTLKRVGLSTERPADHADENDRLTITSPPDLETLAFQPAPRVVPGPGEVEIEILATGLNFKEILYALGMLPAPPDKEVAFGMEACGRVTAKGPGVNDFQEGDEVIAYGDSLFSRYKTISTRLLAPKPSTIGFAQAAGIPLAFMTAYHSLIQRADLRRGERVLIHSASSGVGLAAVKIARWRGAEILATAGNPEKRQYLHSLGIEYVMDSRSPGFADEVMRYTDGQGVDVLLNSLSGEFIPGGLSVLAPYGRFVEIGLRDIQANSQLGLHPFARSLTFLAVTISEKLPGLTDLFRRVVRHIDEGDFSPLPYRLFSRQEVAAAFQYMARAKHIGKIVVGRSSGESELAEIQEGLLRKGIPPSDGLEAFRRIVQTGGNIAGERISRLAVSPRDLKSRLKEGPFSEIPLSARAHPGRRPDTGIHERPLLTTLYAAPDNDIEQRLAEIWQAYLGIEKVGVNDNFFELGASSLDMIQIGSRLKDSLEVEIPVVKMFNHPTIRLLADYVNRGEGEQAASDQLRAGLAGVRKGKAKLKDQRKRRL
jgi:polyketide synthase PksJ